MASLTQHDILEIHPSYCVHQLFLPLYYWVVFHGMDVYLFGLSVHLLWEILLFILFCLEIILLLTILYWFWCGHMLSFFWDKCQEYNFWVYSIINVCLVIWRNWLLSFSVIHLRFVHVDACIRFVFFCCWVVSCCVEIWQCVYPFASVWVFWLFPSFFLFILKHWTSWPVLENLTSKQKS